MEFICKINTDFLIYGLRTIPGDDIAEVSERRKSMKQKNAPFGAFKS
jgi:hypothetical protein